MDKNRLFDAEGMSRRKFLEVMGAAGVTLAGYSLVAKEASSAELATVKEIKQGENVFSYISRVRGSFDQTLYQKVIGAANAFKEGDQAIGVGAEDEATRRNARTLLANTRIENLYEHPLLEDNLQKLLWLTTDQAQYAKVKDWTMEELKEFLLTNSEAEIKGIMLA
jgi:ethanolamine ammonia-lyase large subunit